MIGNDIVDLADPECRAAGQHPRFDDRVFDATERQIIEASPCSERTRWVIWASKESAYKAARKEEPRTVFSPVRFAVRFESEERVSVSIGDRRFRIDVVVDGEQVHAVARGTGDRPIVAAVAPHHGMAPSDAVRRLAIVRLAQVVGVPPEDFEMRREGRIPTLWLRRRCSAADLSLSHHGRFVAFACTLPPHWSVL